MRRRDRERGKKGTERDNESGGRRGRRGRLDREREREREKGGWWRVVAREKIGPGSESWATWKRWAKSKAGEEGGGEEIRAVRLLWAARGLRGRGEEWRL